MQYYVTFVHTGFFGFKTFHSRTITVKTLPWYLTDARRTLEEEMGFKSYSIVILNYRKLTKEVQ